MNGKVLAVKPFNGDRILCRVHHVINAKPVQRRTPGHPRLRAQSGIQLIGGNDGLPDITGILIDLYLYKKILFDLLFDILAGSQHIIPVHLPRRTSKRIGQGGRGKRAPAPKRAPAKWITRAFGRRTRVRSPTAGMDADRDAIAPHPPPIHHGGGPVDDKFTRLLRLQHKGQPLILGHIAVDYAHAAGLDRPLHDSETVDIGWSKLVYLFGIFDDEFYLHIVASADVGAADHGREFHLARSPEPGKKGESDDK